jgi:hypothetical protein
MEAESVSEKLSVSQTAWHYIPEDCNSDFNKNQYGNITLQYERVLFTRKLVHTFYYIDYRPIYNTHFFFFFFLGATARSGLGLLL